MKKTLLTFGVSVAIACGATSYAVTGHNQPAKVAEETPAQTDTLVQPETSSFGVSIGTVEAQLYSESGLNLNYFDDVEYVAQTSDSTYMGFSTYNEWVYNEETGEEYQVSTIALTAISSREDAVTIPDSIKVGDETFAISRIDGEYGLYDGFTSNIKKLTVPSTITRIRSYYDFDRYLDAIYMLGEAPYFENGRLSTTIYVCNRNCFGSYLNNDKYANNTVSPYGWNFEWVTVNVEKPGEFAEMYLTQNDYSWSAAQYVKVTGNINDTDLKAIKNLTALMKLDLSETAITSLPEDFMLNRTSLTEVKLPATLSSIGNSAFRGCSALKTFDLNGITTIGQQVFDGCSSLSYINLNGVQEIGEAAFYKCRSLNNIDLSTVKVIDNGAFYRCSSLESVALDSIARIGDYRDYNYTINGAFAECASLKSVTFGDNLQSIGMSSFANTAIETLILPESLYSLSESAFSSCRNLKSVELPEGLSFIGFRVFSSCTALTAIELPQSLETVSSETFSGCTSLSSVTMKTGLTTIESNAFYGCTSLQEVTIPATVKSIGSSAFANTGIKTFKCYAVVPPTASSSFIGEDMDMTRTYLYVPPFSKDFYRNVTYWSDFYLMRSIDDQIDYILVDRPLTINLEEEDNAVVANNPVMDLRYDGIWHYMDSGFRGGIGQLTAEGEGTLSAGHLSLTASLANRYDYDYGRNVSFANYACPTLINYADKMRADSVSHTLTFYRGFDDDEIVQWHFISLPYDVKVSDIIPGDETYWVIRRYDAVARAAGETSSTWVNLTNVDTMEAGKGYIVSAAGSYPSLSFTSGNSVTKNNIFRPTDVIVPLEEHAAEFAHNRSWNLIGNPYPCYFDMHFLNEEFTAPITIWNGYAYTAYSPVDDDLVLAPYEAFFVQCPLNATEMTFRQEGRMHSDAAKNNNNDDYEYVKGRKPKTATDRNVFNFEVAGEHSTDRARIALNPEATMDYEVGRDASKFFSDNSDCAQIYVAGDVNYSISERPVDDGTATLGVRVSKAGDYTLSLSGRYSSEWHVIVTDNLTDFSVDLTEQDYQFTAAAGDASGRFSVKFRVGDQTGIKSIFADFGEDADVTVSAVNGTVVYTGRLSEMNVPTAGLYIISNGKETRKAILK